MICQHGQLKRQCDLCEKDAEIAALREELARTRNAAKTGMDSAHAAATYELVSARRFYAEANPAVIESERAANAALTEEIEALRARIAELEAAQEWKPIESAPIGERALLLTDTKYILIGERTLTGWTDDDCGGLRTPIGWMPLPKGLEE